jgi:RNA polymerase sigma-70 factor (ECF subfamily)
MVFFQSASKFEKIVLPHLPSAYNLARWLLGADSDAEDVVQEACLRAYEHFDGFRGGDARAWLLTIVRNSAFTTLRKLPARPETLSLDDDLLDEPALGGGSMGTESAALEAISLQELRRAIDLLPPEYREVVILRDMEGLPYLEIAGVIDAPIGTVMSRLSRARRRLRSQVSCLFTEDGEGRS